MLIIDTIVQNNTNQLAQLLAQGADPNFTEDADNITPLHYAISYNCYQAVLMLLTAGADINQEASYIPAPINFALVQKKMAFYNLLIKVSSLCSTAVN